MARRRKRPNREFLQQLKHAIHQVSGTQYVLAEQLGLSQAHISRVLNGHDHLSIERGMKLAVLTGLDPLFIWEGMGQTAFVEAHRQIFGPAQRPAVVTQTGHEDQRILDALHRLNEHDRRFLVEIITKEDRKHGSTR
jgi:plasmid maintenance system antidote protein VapI